MEMERQQHSRTPEPRDKNQGTRSMGQILARQEEGQDSRRRTISFSSEAPYRRYFGMEILDHAEGAVDLGRLNSVGVLLFNHDVDKVVEQLNELKGYDVCANISCETCSYTGQCWEGERGQKVAIDRAVEIAKGGGIEW